VFHEREFRELSSKTLTLKNTITYGEDHPGTCSGCKRVKIPPSHFHTRNTFSYNPYKRDTFRCLRTCVKCRSKRDKYRMHERSRRIIKKKIEHHCFTHKDIFKLKLNEMSDKRIFYCGYCDKMMIDTFKIQWHGNIYTLCCLTCSLLNEEDYNFEEFQMLISSTGMNGEKPKTSDFQLPKVDLDKKKRTLTVISG